MHDVGDTAKDIDTKTRNRGIYVKAKRPSGNFGAFLRSSVP